MCIKNCPYCKHKLTALGSFTFNNITLFTCKNECFKNNIHLPIKDRFYYDVDNNQNIIYYNLLLEIGDDVFTLYVNFPNNFTFIKNLNTKKTYKFSGSFAPKEDMNYYINLVNRLLKLQHF